MLIKIIHSSGEPYLIPVHQAIVYSDNGDPVAIVYERDKMIVYTDIGQDDFGRVADQLKIKKIDCNG